MRQTIQTSLFCVACFTEKLSSRLQSFANKFACSYDMNLCHGTVVLSQCLVELTQHARLNTLDMGALCSFAVYGCMGPKREAQETVNKFYPVISWKAVKLIPAFAFSWLCEHGFSALTEVRSETGKTYWYWRWNASLLDVTGTSHQFDLLWKAGTAIALEN